MAASDFYGQPELLVGSDVDQFTSEPTYFLSDYLSRNRQTILNLDTFKLSVAHIATQANQRSPGRMQTRRRRLWTNLAVPVPGLNRSDPAACHLHRKVLTGLRRKTWAMVRYVPAVSFPLTTARTLHEVLLFHEFLSFVIPSFLLGDSRFRGFLGGRTTFLLLAGIRQTL